MSARRRSIVLLGMMAKMPVAGVVWQTVHYLVGLQRLGHAVHYVETHARTPAMLASDAGDDGSGRAAAFIDGVMRRFGIEGGWAFRALHSDGRCYGMAEADLLDLYRAADLIINLHGGTRPSAELAAGGRLVYLETDPVALQVELHQGLRGTLDFLAPHRAFFTFGENYGRPGCKLPVSERFAFRPTRQPVVLDFWTPRESNGNTAFTTVANWRQVGRDVVHRGERYGWSKDEEFLKFLDLPQLAEERFELALTNCELADRRRLEAHGWCVRDALALSADVDVYRDYIAESRGEFTVAKDQNVRLRSGWFSDRSATYLAAGRPVITQDTGFGEVLPTGRGLFAFNTLDDIRTALEEVRRDYAGQRRAALEIARDYFSHDVVLGQLLAEVGV